VSRARNHMRGAGIRVLVGEVTVGASAENPTQDPRSGLLAPGQWYAILQRRFLILATNRLNPPASGFVSGFGTILVTNNRGDHTLLSILAVLLSVLAPATACNPT